MNHHASVRHQEKVQPGRGHTPASLDSSLEHMLITAAALLAGVATRHLLQSAWKAARGKQPPHNPAAADVAWTEALSWAAAVGATAGVARVLSRRMVTAATRRYSH